MNGKFFVIKAYTRNGTSMIVEIVKSKEEAKSLLLQISVGRPHLNFIIEEYE